MCVLGRALCHLFMEGSVMLLDSGKLGVRSPSSCLWREKVCDCFALDGVMALH